MSLAACSPLSPAEAAANATTGAGSLRVEVLNSVEAARPVWSQLLADGMGTPYQSAEWISAYLNHVDSPGGADAAIVVLREASGAPVMLLPLAIAKRGPLRIARFVGGKHSNFNAPLFTPGAERRSRAAIATALHEAGRSLGVDLFAFTNQPFDWQGRANPLAVLGGQPSPSAGYKFALGPDAEDILKAQLSKDTRKKLRQKEGKLRELGPVRYVKPAPGEEALGVLAAFLDLKAARFVEQGIDDPFAGSDVRAFLSDVTAGGTLEFHALMVGERPAAIYAGVADSRRFSGVVTAFNADPEIARASPGDILLTYMVRDMCARGLSTFDLGVGEAHYKAKICDTTEPLFDSTLAITTKGKLVALALSGMGQAKRWLKQSPRGQALLGLLRKQKARA